MNCLWLCRRQSDPNKIQMKCRIIHFFDPHGTGNINAEIVEIEVHSMGNKWICISAKPSIRAYCAVVRESDWPGSRMPWGWKTGSGWLGYDGEGRQDPCVRLVIIFARMRRPAVDSWDSESFPWRKHRGRYIRSYLQAIPPTYRERSGEERKGETSRERAADGRLHSQNGDELR